MMAKLKEGLDSLMTTPAMLGAVIPWFACIIVLVIGMAKVGDRIVQLEHRLSVMEETR